MDITQMEPVIQVLTWIASKKEVTMKRIEINQPNNKSEEKEHTKYTKVLLRYK